MNNRVGYVVSPHGFGHAARAAAVLSALRGIRPDAVFHIFTTIPEWFWRDSLEGPFERHEVLTDVGLVQLSPLEEDPTATLEALEALRPLRSAARPLADSLRRCRCDFVVCDIAPLGIAAARLAGIPCVLVENFTWDWIYQSYFEEAPGLRPVAAEMGELFDSVDLRIQAEPVSRLVAGADLVRPVYRRARSSARRVREALGVLDDRPIVVMTMGGASWEFDLLDRLAAMSEVIFAVFVGAREVERRGNLLLLPGRSPVFMPDLMMTAEAVVGKLGYSTVAEAWAAGTRYAYVPRALFPEGPSLASFVQAHLPSLEIDVKRFRDGEWLESLAGLLAETRPERQSENGADQIARKLGTWLPG